MSAAAPLPPPGPPPARAMYSVPNGAGAGADGFRGSDGAGNPRGSGGQYPPIAEIVASASETMELLRHRSVPRQTALSTCDGG